MYKMICGKYDSRWKWQYKDGRKFRLILGHFDTAMNYACKHKGGMQLIEHIRNQPWESWTK